VRTCVTAIFACHHLEDSPLPGAFPHHTTTSCYDNNGKSLVSQHISDMTTPEKYPLLSRINSPADLRRLSLEELPQLCRELRQDIFEELGKDPRAGVQKEIQKRKREIFYTKENPPRGEWRC